MPLLLRRILSLVATVLGTSGIFSALLWITPGSPGRTGEKISLITWLSRFWIGVVTGDLGESYRGYPVGEMVQRGLLTSLPSILVALVLSISLAWVLALSRNVWALRPLRVLLHLLSLCPVFLLGYLAVVLFAVPPEGFGQRLAAVLVLALGDGLFTDALGTLEGEIKAVLDKDFVHGARLRGRSVFPILAQHLALPTAQLMASRIGFLLGGILVLEMVLGIQGLGLMGYRAARHGDFPLLLAITVTISFVLALAQIGVDVLRIGVDPRARHDRRIVPRVTA